MEHIFICYSHTDRELAIQLKEKLESAGKIVWIDLEDLPASSSWSEEIRNSITEAIAFIYLVSDDSLHSEYCQREIDFACTLNKRVFPILTPGMLGNKIPERISSFQWLQWDEFGKNLDITRLITAIDTDYAWVKFITNLGLKASHWEKQKDNSRLLRGRELQEAEGQLAGAAARSPQPTGLLHKYIFESRRNEERQRRRVTLGLSFGVAILALLAVFAWFQRNNALVQASIALARKLSANSELLISQQPKQLPLAVLLAAESGKQVSTFEGDQALRDGLNLLPALVARMEILPNSSASAYSSAQVNDPVTVMTFSPDNHWLAIGTEGEIISVWSTSTWTEAMRVAPASYGGYVAVVRALAFSPDSKFLVSGSDGRYAQVWDIGKGQPVAQFKHDGQVFIAAFTPDGRRVISGSENKVVVWDPQTGSQLYSLNAGTELLAMSKDGKLAASVTTLCIANVFYVGRRLAGSEKAMNAVHDCTEAFEVLAVDRRTVETALALPGSDFEDNIQIAAALQANGPQGGGG